MFTSAFLNIIQQPVLHGNQAQYIRDGAEQDDDDKHRADIFDHKDKDTSSAEGMSVHQDFRDGTLDGHTSGDKKADAECRDGHHHGVCQKIKEIQELHSDDSDIGERSVAQTGKGAQDEHDHSDDDSAALPAPDKFI